MYPGDGCISLLLICTLKGGSNHEFLHVYFSQLKKKCFYLHIKKKTIIVVILRRGGE